MEPIEIALVDENGNYARFNNPFAWQSGTRRIGKFSQHVIEENMRRLLKHLEEPTDEAC